MDEERGEKRMRLQRYDRKDGTVVRDLKVIANQQVRENIKGDSF